jgi:hypothetical protein
VEPTALKFDGATVDGTAAEPLGATVIDPSHRRPGPPPPLGNTPAPMRIPASGPIRLSPPAEFPPDAHPTWEELIKNPCLHEFRYAAAGMLIFNLNLQWKRDPTKLMVLVKQVRDFFRKYQHLLGDDIRKLFD